MVRYSIGIRMIEIFIFLAFTPLLKTECQGKFFVLTSLLPLKPVEEVVVHSTSVIMCYQHFELF